GLGGLLRRFATTRDTVHENDELAKPLLFMACHPGDEFGKRSGARGLELLCQLARNCRLAITTEDLGHVLQTFHNTVRRFVENQGARLRTQTFERSTTG